MHPHHICLQDYQKFLSWFKENYPELYTRYTKNFDHPVKKGGKVTVNNASISFAERSRLIEIAKLYYKQPVQ